MKSEVQTLLDGLKARFDPPVLELAGLINVISRAVPPEHARVLQLFALCVRARIGEQGLDPGKVVQAVEEIAQAQQTVAILREQDFAEPTHVDDPTKSLLDKFRI